MALKNVSRFMVGLQEACALKNYLACFARLMELPNIPIECFHVTSGRLCWCPQLILRELNPILMQTFSFVFRRKTCELITRVKTLYTHLVWSNPGRNVRALPRSLRHNACEMGVGGGGWGYFLYNVILLLYILYTIYTVC